MFLKNYTTALLFFGISFASFSQHKYSVEVESFNNKQPREVLEEFSQHIEDYKRSIEDGVFFFESKVLYTEENFKEIAAATGYEIKQFKIIAKNEEDAKNEESGLN